jgi:hypothetical protein
MLAKAPSRNGGVLTLGGPLHWHGAGVTVSEPVATIVTDCWRLTWPGSIYPGDAKLRLGHGLAASPVFS